MVFKMTNVDGSHFDLPCSVIIFSSFIRTKRCRDSTICESYWIKKNSRVACSLNQKSEWHIDQNLAKLLCGFLLNSKSVRQEQNSYFRNKGVMMTFARQDESSKDHLRTSCVLMKRFQMCVCVTAPSEILGNVLCITNQIS